MRPSLQQLESFYWVARLGSVHAAARHQNLTQPAITARLRELEDIVGEQLFDRGGYKLGLKPHARELFTLAEQILKLAERFSGARPEDAPGLGLLRLGANESSAMIGLSTFLARLKLLFPRLRVELQVDIGTELSRRLNARELDMAILSSPMSAAHIVDEPLGSVDLQWVAPLSFRPPVIVPGPMAREAAASGALKILKVNPAVPPISYFVSYLQEVAPAARQQIVPLAREVFIDCGLIRPRA